VRNDLRYGDGHASVDVIVFPRNDNLSHMDSAEVVDDFVRPMRLPLLHRTLPGSLEIEEISILNDSFSSHRQDCLSGYATYRRYAPDVLGSLELQCDKLTSTEIIWTCRCHFFLG